MRQGSGGSKFGAVIGLGAMTGLTYLMYKGSVM